MTQLDTSLLLSERVLQNEYGKRLLPVIDLQTVLRPPGLKKKFIKIFKNGI